MYVGSSCLKTTNHVKELTIKKGLYLAHPGSRILTIILVSVNTSLNAILIWTVYWHTHSNSEYDLTDSSTDNIPPTNVF